MNVLLWIFAIIGFVMVVGLILLIVWPKTPPSYIGSEGDWERYRDRCTGNYDEKNDRPKR